MREGDKWEGSDEQRRMNPWVPWRPRMALTAPAKSLEECQSKSPGIPAALLKTAWGTGQGQGVLTGLGTMVMEMVNLAVVEVHVLTRPLGVQGERVLIGDKGGKALWIEESQGVGSCQITLTVSTQSYPTPERRRGEDSSHRQRGDK